MRLKRNRYFPMLVKQDIPVIKSRFIADSFIVGEKPLGLYGEKEVSSRFRFYSVN